MDLNPKLQTNRALNFNMLYNTNVILNTFLYRKCSLFRVHKYLIYRFYLAGNFVACYFAKLQKQSLGFFVICVETYRSMTHKKCFLETYENFYGIIKGFRFNWKHKNQIYLLLTPKIRVDTFSRAEQTFCVRILVFLIQHYCQI